MGLQDELNALREQSMSKIPKATAAIMADAITELKQAGITDRSKHKGDLAPDFELRDAGGSLVSSKALLEKGPLVISFYRGSW